MIEDATFWALIALIIFLAVMVYLKAPGIVTAALDKRADTIRKELDEARRLREEAQALLADYQRKGREAETEADLLALAGGIWAIGGLADSLAPRSEDPAANAREAAVLARLRGAPADERS